MSSQLLEILNGVKTMSIVGMCKNAGKTTMLNWMLHHDRLRGTLGLTSIGRDGESTDVVTGTEKPGIFVREGTLIATARDMLRLGDVTTEIDGALGRKSLGARAVAEGVVLCTGASYHMSMEKVVADTANIYRIMNLPKAETLPPEAEEGLEKCLKEHGEALAPGALTDSMVVPLLRSGVLRGGRLVVKDPSRVLLTPDTLDKLRTRQVRLETAEAARTLCVTINPVSAYGWKFDKDEFMARMKEAVDVPVINVKEELA